MKRKRYILFTAYISFMLMCASCEENVAKDDVKADSEQRTEQETGILNDVDICTDDIKPEPKLVMDKEKIYPYVPEDDAVCMDMNNNYIITIHEDEKTGASEICLWTNEAQPKLIQKFPCKTNIENTELRCDDLNQDTYPDLQVLYKEENGGDGKGYLYLWDWKNYVFSEDCIEIPTEYELTSNMGDRKIVVTEVDEEWEVRKICKVDEEWGKFITIREWRLEKESGYLTVYDCYSEQVLFDGRMENEKYCEYLFWYDLPVIYHRESDSVISVWSGDHYGEEFPDKESFLNACGFAGEEPFFTHCDNLGNIQVELYFDEENDSGCCIDYAWSYTDIGTKSAYMTGYIFDEVSEAVWKEPDPYSLLGTDGTDGSASVQDYSEDIAYTEDGKIDSFYSEGMIDWLVDGKGRQKVLEFDFVYRDNGTLLYRRYSHNPWIFSSIWQVEDELYDESERLIYEEGYITHGSVERYYIYADDTQVPLYRLELDQGQSEMVQYYDTNP